MVSAMLYPFIVCVALLMEMFVWCVACLIGFVNCLLKQFAIFVSCGCYFVVECYRSV